MSALYVQRVIVQAGSPLAYVPPKPLQFLRLHYSVLVAAIQLVLPHRHPPGW
jgi:hypothetical protein